MNGSGWMMESGQYGVPVGKVRTGEEERQEQRGLVYALNK